MRFSRHQLLALILGAGMATVLPAQGRGGAGARGGGGGRQMDSLRARRMERLDTTQMAAMRERMVEMSTPAGQILAMRERLGLTDDQVNRLETLKSTYAEPSQTELTKLREDLANATKGEANIPAARAALNKISEATTNAQIVRLEARNKARAVLNGDQQVQFDAVEARRPMGGGMGMVGAGARGAGRGAGGPPPDGVVRRGGRGGGTVPPPPPPIPPSER